MKILEKSKKSLVVKKGGESQDSVPATKESEPEKSNLNPANEKVESSVEKDAEKDEVEEDWADCEEEKTEPTKKPTTKTSHKKKKIKTHTRRRCTLKRVAAKKLKRRGKLVNKEELKTKSTLENPIAEKESGNVMVAEGTKSIEAEPSISTKEDVKSEKEQESTQLNETKEKTIDCREQTRGSEDLDVDSIAINDNATIVSDEGSNGNNNSYELVYMLFSFVDVEPDLELNELLAGYFKGAALALLNGKQKEMAEFLESNLHVVDNLVVHSNNKSIAEVLGKVVSMDDEYFSSSIQFNDVRRNILSKLLARIEDPAVDSYSISQFSQTFCDLIDQSKDIPIICCSMEFLRNVFSISLNNNSNIATSGIKILTKLLGKEKPQLRAFLQEQLGNVPASTESQTKELLKLLQDLLLNFKEKLLEENSVQMNQFGIEISQFGTFRLKIIECLHSLINLCLFPIIEQMYQLQYSKILCDLFVRFPFNSVLHSLLFSVFKSVLESGSKSLLHIVTIYHPIHSLF